MHALEVTMLRIFLPDDKEHLDRVLGAIESFFPSGDVHVYERDSAFDQSGRRIKLGTERRLIVEYIDESDRAMAFVDAFHDVILPGRIIGSTVYMCAGEEESAESDGEEAVIEDAK